MPVTLQDVAHRAGVHKSIASRVLSGDPRASVSQDAQRRVREAARDLGYRPNALARGLRKKVSGAITLVIPDMSNPVYAEIVRGAEAEAQRSHYFLLLTSTYGTEAGEREFLRAALESRVDGLLLASALIDDAVIGDLERDRFPYVLVNRQAHEASRFVVTDDRGGSLLAVEHLIAHGHRRIGHIGGPPSAYTAVARAAAYREALEHAGIPFDPGLLVHGEYSIAGGRDALRRLMELPDPPTAIFAASFQLAAGAVETAFRMGKRIPQDLSIVNIDETEFAATIPPGLTTVRLPLADMGREAVRMLLRAVAGEEGETQIVLPQAGLVRRGSVASRRP